MRTKPEMYSSFLERRAKDNEHSGHLPQCPDARASTSIFSTSHHRHRNHTAVSDAKYCMFVDIADMMIHGTSDLEVGKKSNLPFGQGCPRLQKRCLKWIPI